MKYKKGSISKVHINSEYTRCKQRLNVNIISGSEEKEKNSKRDSYMKSLQFGAQVDNLQESHIVSARTLKRGSAYLSQDEVNVGTSLKFKITQKEGKRLRVITTSHEKVDADVAREDINSAYRKTANDDREDDSVTCSVGSCSINRYSDHNIQSKSNAFEDTESYSSDAESACQGGYEDEIHRLELQAYRHTIEALHASGPLTWEKETMVTNLRMFLHISNDEHLIMLKNLISTANTIRNR
ncbi:putative ENT domain-containing protein [Helianthus annuus]|nr:putative ENT domain-containing protein [Helianthus annuus]